MTGSSLPLLNSMREVNFTSRIEFKCKFERGSSVSHETRTMGKRVYTNIHSHTNGTQHTGIERKDTFPVPRGAGDEWDDDNRYSTWKMKDERFCNLKQ